MRHSFHLIIDLVGGPCLVVAFSGWGLLPDTPVADAQLVIGIKTDQVCHLLSLIDDQRVISEVFSSLPVQTKQTIAPLNPVPYPVRYPELRDLTSDTLKSPLQPRSLHILGRPSDSGTLRCLTFNPCFSAIGHTSASARF